MIWGLSQAGNRAWTTRRYLQCWDNGPEQNVMILCPAEMVQLQPFLFARTSASAENMLYKTMWTRQPTYLRARAAVTQTSNKWPPLSQTTEVLSRCGVHCEWPKGGARGFLDCKPWPTCRENVVWRNLQGDGHRSHFGSRYKLGWCGNAGLFWERFKSSWPRLILLRL